MRKIFSLFLVMVLGMLLLVTNNVEARRRCPPRNKHCQATATATVTVVMTATAGRIATISVDGTEIIYTCQSLGCETPGKP